MNELVILGVVIVAIGAVGAYIYFDATRKKEAATDPASLIGGGIGSIATGIAHLLSGG